MVRAEPKPRGRKAWRPKGVRRKAPADHGPARPGYTKHRWVSRRLASDNLPWLHSRRASYGRPLERKTSCHELVVSLKILLQSTAESTQEKAQAMAASGPFADARAGEC